MLRLVDWFESEDVWKPAGRGFNMGRIQPEGIVIHLTGQVSWDQQSRLVGLGDVRAQTQQCFHNIDCLLREVGGELGDIVSLTTYFLDLEHLPLIQEVRAATLRGPCAPASTSIRVAGLGHADFLVELTPVAVVPTARFRPPKQTV